MRQQIEWLPFELVPDDSDRGYRLVQHNPLTDPETGITTYEMHGYSLRATTTDGYHVTVILELDPAEGTAVTRLTIKPSRFVEEGDRYRPREPDEVRKSPINTSVLKLISFTDIVNRIVDVENLYARATVEIPEVSGAATDRAQDLKKRGPRRDNKKHARQAEQVLNSMRQGRGYQTRLGDEWIAGRNTVKKRISQLRERGWLTGRAPGLLLETWRNEHGPNHWKEKDN